jgi:hypothetical protein
MGNEHGLALEKEGAPASIIRPIRTLNHGDLRPGTGGAIWFRLQSRPRRSNLAMNLLIFIENGVNYGT